MVWYVQVELSNIGFRYPSRSDTVALEDVSLELQPGKLVALVGLSGSGKSTLVALLQRLYDPNYGQVHCTPHHAPCHCWSRDLGRECNVNTGTSWEV